MKIINEQSTPYPADGLGKGGEHYTLYVGGVSSHIDGDEVIFDPPLEISGYRETGSDEISYYYDFGLSDKFLMSRPAFWDGPDMSWTERLKSLVRFDLEHAFFHVSMDPNYVADHYALLGCLCLRGRTTYKRENGETVKMDWIP